MKYEMKSFSVPASSAKSPADCKHGWWDQRMHCVLCGKDANDAAREKHEHYLRVGIPSVAGNVPFWAVTNETRRSIPRRAVND